MRTITDADYPAVLAAVAACPDRGPSLPVAEQPYSRGCRCPELWACRAARGKRPEGASLEDCVRCRLSDPSQDHQREQHPDQRQ